MTSDFFNIAQFLPERARSAPDRAAVICSHAPDLKCRTRLTFRELDEQSDIYAWGLRRTGIKAGQRTLLMVRPGLDFIALTFSLFKLGTVPVLIDPGMGKKNLLDCIKQVKPDAFIAIPLAHALRVLTRDAAFNTVQTHVTVGRRWFWEGYNISEIERFAAGQGAFPIAETTRSSPAAILFTTGSTGIPKGVLYRHGMFEAQVLAIRQQYGIEPGEVDLPAFPLFALFSTALGTTCVIPDMDPTRPAQCDPAKIVNAIREHKVTYTFGSPSIWKRVGPYCVENKIKLPGLKRILMAGAPVRGNILEPFAQILDSDADTHIPYGATEALPVANMRGSEVLRETWALTRQGKGYCVGRPLPGVTVKILAVDGETGRRGDGAKRAEAGTRRHGDAEHCGMWDESLVLPPGEIGEIVVKGAVVTQEYFDMPSATRAAKIYESSDTQGANGRRDAGGPINPQSAMQNSQSEVWHRMGDMGYFDEQGRLWFCGRKAHRVVLKNGCVIYSVCAEASFESALERESGIKTRAALVGIGEYGSQIAGMVIEHPHLSEEVKSKLQKLDHRISHIFAYPHPFPVDIRHNAKINREQLAKWATEQLKAKTL